MEKKYSELEIKTAAYVLNMCTVSVSQIVDYKDLYVLEQEYESILNNLNLEKMPKDETLLKILKQLLDTITFFRIDETEKNIAEKEYQQKIKNAIWYSCPNFGMLISGGNILTTAVSLASQVGIGYMNYRKNLAEEKLNIENKRWQLQKSAIEQFNGLRRELFDTAWRLADTYQFSDDYRLTERQIKQYNEILLDSDEFRKIERLELIKNKFMAYPPFWYYLGHSYNYALKYLSDQLDAKIKDKYKEKALKCFSYFDELNKICVLREDYISAACALEHISLLEESDKEGKRVLLSEARKKAGLSFDILELCAIEYLKLGEWKESEEILKQLVNEDYNRTINAQMLSGIFVAQHKKNDYDLLSKRVGNEFLYPYPENDSLKDKTLYDKFIDTQRKNLKDKYSFTLENYIEKFSVEWNKHLFSFEVRDNHPDSFFLDSEMAQNERMRLISKYISSADKQLLPIHFKTIGYESVLITYLNDFCDGLRDIPEINDDSLSAATSAIKLYIISNAGSINLIQKSIDSGVFSFNDYCLMSKHNIKSIVAESSKILNMQFDSIVDNCDSKFISIIDGKLNEFCTKHRISVPIAILQNNNWGKSQDDCNNIITLELLGRSAIIDKENLDNKNVLIKLIRERFDNMIIEKATGFSVLYPDNNDFKVFFSDELFKKYPEIQMHALTVLKADSLSAITFVFTTQGLVIIEKNKVFGLFRYSEIKLSHNHLKIANKVFESFSFNAIKLYGLMNELDERTNNTPTDMVMNVDSKLIADWFKQFAEISFEKTHKLIYYHPQKGDLEKLGYSQPNDYATLDNIIILCFTSDDIIIKKRMIRYQYIETNLENCLKVKKVLEISSNGDNDK